MNCPGPDSVTHDRHCISIPTVTLLSLRRATRAQHVNIGLGHISDLHTSHSHASTSRGSLPVPTLVPMIQGDTNASGVWAWRQLELLSKNLPSTQEKLGSRRLDEARDLARKDEASIRPSDMKSSTINFFSAYYLYKSYLKHVRRLSVRQKSGQVWSQKVAFQGSYMHENTESLPKIWPVLRFVEVTLAHRIAQETSLITS